jgi:hypothetical protein|tara:strand:+ start:2986 stop:3261 length:276 start_codon:yes stop_codon:yes gene_type:complete
MRLVQFHCEGHEHFINPDNIRYVRSKWFKKGAPAQITFTDNSVITVDETLKTTIALINNQELNVAYDCMGEIERLKQTIKNLQRNTQPSEV